MFNIIYWLNKKKHASELKNEIRMHYWCSSIDGKTEQGSKENNQQMPQVEEKVFTDEELVQLIDPILKMDDTSNDGYIDYPEFIRAQQKAAAQQHHQQQPQHR